MALPRPTSMFDFGLTGVGNPAAAQLGELLRGQVQTESDEEKKRRLRQMQERTRGYSPAGRALFGGGLDVSNFGGGY